MAEEQARMVVCPQCGKKYKLKAEFDAASFQCKECAATVPVKKEAKIEPRKGARPASRTKAAAAGRSARSRRGGKEEEAEGRGEHGGGRHGRHAAAPGKPGSQNLLIALGGLGLVIALVLFLVLKGGKEEPSKKTAKGPAPAESQPEQPSQPETPAPAPGAGSPAVATPANAPGQPAAPQQPGTTPPAGTTPGETPPATPGGTTPPAEEPGKKLSGGGEKKSKWDPPADLGFPPEATAEDQKEIDRLISVVCDPMAGRDGLDAKERLVTYDKKAFPRVLGTMAKIRDTIGDVDSMEERQAEASLYLLDKVLREMDGFLDSRNAQPIRPGTDKKYIASVLQRHYKRWVETLSKMDKMPGVYDASGEYEKEEGGAKPPQ